MRAALTGRTLSAEHRAHIASAMRAPDVRARLSAANTRRWETFREFGDPRLSAKRSRDMTRRMSDPATRSLICSRRQPSTLEQALCLLLQDAGLEFSAEESFGSYAVDFWVPSHGLVFEADGYYHIPDQAQIRDRLRDAKLLDDPRINAVIHLTARDLAPWMEA